MQYEEALHLFLSEMRSQAQQQGITLEADAIDFSTDAFQRTVRSGGIPNSATIKETAKRWVARLVGSA